MTIDGEEVTGIACCGNESKPVSFTKLDVDNSERRIWLQNIFGNENQHGWRNTDTYASNITPLTINQCGVRYRTCMSGKHFQSFVVIPVEWMTKYEGGAQQKLNEYTNPQVWWP